MTPTPGLPPREWVDTRFSPDGPHNHDQTLDAAAALTELVRYLTVAAGADDALPYPATVDSTVHYLEDTARDLRQLLYRLGDSMNDHMDNPAAYVTGNDSLTRVQEGIAARIIMAARAAADLHDNLARLRCYTSRVGLDIPNGTE